MKQKILVFIMFCLLGFGVYSQTLNDPFHFDDYPFIVENETIKDIGNLSEIWKGVLPQHSRFVAFYSFAVNYHFNQLDVFGYHLVNVSIHVLVSLLVCWLSTLLIELPQISNDIKNNKNIISLFAGLLFLCHPVQTQAITYISQRFASLATLFYMLSVCLYIKARLLQRVNKQGIVLLFGSLVSAVCSMFTKEIAITIPIMILVIEIMFFSKRGRNNIIVILLLMLMFVIPCQFDFGIQDLFFSHKISNSHDGDIITFSSYFSTQFRVFMTFIRLLILPVNQNVDYDFPLSQNLFELSAFLSAFGFILLFVFSIMVRRRIILISFGMLWVFITFLPNFVPRSDVIFEHKLYLISVGFCIAVSLLFVIILKEKRKVLPVLSVLVLILSIASFNRNKVWGSELLLWEDIARKSPRKWRVHYNLGNEYSSLGMHEKALISVDRAIQLNPYNADSYNNKGNILARVGQYDASFKEYSIALKLDASHYKAYANRGTIYRLRNRMDLAINDYTESISLNPNYAFAYYNRSIAFKIIGEFQKSMRDAVKAEELGRNISNDYFRMLKNEMSK